MKLFAHRGWSAGEIENTIEAFKKSRDAGLGGVELDVRFDANRKDIILSHDYTEKKEVVTLKEALEFLRNTNLELLIEFKEYTPDFFERVIKLLVEYHTADRATIFAFSERARDFPWGQTRNVRLGIISRYPHHIKKDIQKYKPDMILFGWGNKVERFIVKTYWSVYPLAWLTRKYPHIKFVMGVAYGQRDMRWLGKQGGLYGATVDKR